MRRRGARVAGQGRQSAGPGEGRRGIGGSASEGGGEGQGLGSGQDPRRHGERSSVGEKAAVGGENKQGHTRPDGWARPGSVLPRALGWAQETLSLKKKKVSYIYISLFSKKFSVHLK